MVRDQSIDGLGVTYNEIKHLSVNKSLAEYKGKMTAFPIYPSLTNKSTHQLFEAWSVDDVPISIKSLEGYIGYFSYVELSTKFRHVMGYKSSISELPSSVNILINRFGPRVNPKAKPLRMFILDGSSTNLSEALNEVCTDRPNSTDPIIQRLVSAPHKHQQNTIESHIQHEKNGMRTNLAYNKAPTILWFKALKYTIRNINITHAPDSTISRMEAMNNKKPDVSHYVPFYAKGYAFIHHDERQLNSALASRATEVFMVGYADDLDDLQYTNIQFKQSFQCYKPPNQILIRHDVVWEHLAPHPSLLNDNIRDRFHETFDHQNELLKELELRFNYPNNIQPTHVDEYDITNEDIDPINDYHDEPIENSCDNEELTAPIVNERPRRNVIPNVRLQDAIFAEGGGPRINSSITQTIENHNIPLRNDHESNYWMNEMINSGQLKSPIFHDTPTHNHEKHTNDGTFIGNVNTQSPTEIRRDWIQSLINSTPIKTTNTKTNQSTPFKAHMILQNDGSLNLYNDPAPRNNIHDILREYSRVIEDIDIASHTNKIIYRNKTKSNLLSNTYYKSNTTQSTHTNSDEPSSIPQTPILHLPISLEDALNSADGDLWKEAWDQEMERLGIRDTWTVLSENDDPPRGHKPIKSKFIFKIKVNRDGTLRYKVRLCACGYSQKYGIDYDETFAPTAKYKSLCAILTIAAANHWHMTGIDVENAFVEAPIDRPIYMNLPEKAYKNTNGKPITVLLNKSLYGLKQAPELWDKFLVKAIHKQGFTQLMHDQCVFIKITSEGTIILIKYVDDIIITGDNKTLINSILNKFEKSFTKMTHEDTVQRYVGLDIDYDRENGTLKLSQKPYIQKILKKFNIDPSIFNDTSKFRTPLNPLLDYRTLGDNSLTPMRDLTGSLRFLADRTLPNILSSCSLLSTAAHNPTANHKSGGAHTLKYLNNHQDDHIILGGDPHINLFGYADAAHISQHDSKSQLGFCFFLNTTSGAVVAKSKRDTTVSHSSTEAEIKAVDLAIREATWFRGFLHELGYPQHGPTPIYTDNLSAKTLADTNNTSSQTGHLVLRINYIHQEQKAGNIILKWINTENNVADILTKALPYPIYTIHTDTIMHGHHGQQPTIAPITSRDKKRKSTTSKDTVSKRKK